MATKKNKFIEELSKPVPGKNRFTEHLEKQIEDNQYKVMSDYLGEYFDKRDLDRVMETLFEDYDKAFTAAASSAAASTISSGTTASMGPPSHNATTSYPSYQYNAKHTGNVVPNTIINTGNYGLGSIGNSTWAIQDTVRVDGTLSADEIRVGKKKLSEVLDKIQERLGILDDPSTEKLEKFEALKKAYEQYKILEKLCFEQGDDEK